ncbi:MAG: ribonuclease Y [Clostridia bacterium]|nr:ribonuclease Y [Clostridia bacterium]
MVHFVWLLVACVLCVALGIGLTYFLMAKRFNQSKNNAAKILENAYAEAKTAKKEAILEAKEEIHNLKEKCDSEIAERYNEISKSENRLALKEELLIKKEEGIDKKVESLDVALNQVKERETELENAKKEIEQASEKMTQELEKVSNLTRDEAKQQLIDKFVEEAKHDCATKIRQMEQDAEDKAEAKAKEIVTLAVQKCATNITSEITVTVVPLPNDELKGRIIGREGRNIRAIENATGIDLIIDDTPEAVVLSGFDPVRREVARVALEKLIMDGRIHPARIEEIVEKAQKDVDSAIKEAGENAVYEAGIIGIHNELIKVLGRLKYRTSYGQNALKHSLEVCHISGLLAAELGANVKIAKRGGLLHDLGKALDHEQEGTHVSIGVELAKKYKESPEVIHCIQAHHGEVEFNSLEAIIVQTADAISSSRPGARRELLDAYIKRLENLENIANGFKGVEKSFAIQAGREIRIMVKPEEVNDETMVFLARDIARKIENELQYPGQIKVNVIRETRATDIAK